MPELDHEHDWRWNESYIEAGGYPLWCLDPKCSATMPMPRLIDRARELEHIRWEDRQERLERDAKDRALYG